MALAKVVGQTQAGLDGGQPAGDGGKIGVPGLLGGGEGAVIGCQHVQVPTDQPIPQRLVVLLCSQRWRADQSLSAGRVQRRLVQQQVLGAGLTVDFFAARAGGLDAQHCLLARDVDDVEGTPGQRGKIYGVAHRLRLLARRAGERVVDRGDVAMGHCLCAQHLANGIVFAMHDGQPPGVRDGPHSAVESRVVQPQGVGQVEFKARRASRHDLRQRVQYLWVIGMPCGDGHVQAIVYRHAAIRFSAAFPQRFQQRFLQLWLNEINHCRRAAQRRRDGASDKIVGAGVISHRHLQVDVGINPAGQHVATGSVQFNCAVQVLAQGDDALARNAYIGRENSVRCDQRPIFDDQFHISHLH